MLTKCRDERMFEEVESRLETLFRRFSRNHHRLPQLQRSLPSALLNLGKHDSTFTTRNVKVHGGA